MRLRRPLPAVQGDTLHIVGVGDNRIGKDCYAPHASEPNRSKLSRRLYYVTYNRLSAGDNLDRYYADKHRSYPPDIEREPGKEYVFRV